MTADDPLLLAWRETLARRRDEPAIFDTQRRVLFRFAEIEEQSRQFEKSIGLTNFESGEVVAIQIGNDPQWPALFLACLRRGLVVLPLEKSMNARERAVALQICRVSGLIRNAQAPVERTGFATATDWNGRAPVLFKLTSGTTAAPRAIRFRSAQLLADAAQICATMGITAADLNFAVIPLSHSYGFSNLITPLLTPGVPMIVSDDRMPRAVLENLARTDATVFPGMPLFFQAFAEMSDVPPLRALRLCISAGAPLPLIVAQNFRQKFGLPLHSFYGASECGGICYDREGSCDAEGFVGRPMDGVTIEPLSENAESTQIRVRSAAAGDGYFPEPESEKLGPGFFIPDDLVDVSADGVRIVGRLSDVINVAGKKVNPAEVEAQLLRCDAVQEAVVFGRASKLRNEEVAACVVARGAITESDLLEFCRDRLSGWQVPKRIFFVDALPRNERGKISRRELAGKFAG